MEQARLEIDYATHIANVIDEQGSEVRDRIVQFADVIAKQASGNMKITTREMESQLEVKLVCITSSQVR